MDEGRLEKRIERNRDYRAREEARMQPYKDRLKAIMESPDVMRTDFYCQACAKDFTARGYKQTRSLSFYPVCYYAAQCPKGHVCLRYVTDKHRDPYYWQSKMLQIQRVTLADAMLTPSDPRFKIVYPDKYRELMEEQNASET